MPVGKVGKIRRVPHARRHERSVKVGSHPDVVRAYETNCMIDMFDDFLQVNLRQFPVQDGFDRSGVNSSMQLACLVRIGFLF